MLKPGDRATGVPANPNVRRNYPTVTGVYDTFNVDNEGLKFLAEYVVLSGGQSIDVSSARPASRRDKDTERVVAS